MTKDKRRDKRITINHEFSSVDNFINEYVVNISKRGVFIKTDNPLPVGTEVNLRFSVIVDDIETIEGKGRVVWIKKPKNKGDIGGMGVVFTHLTGYSKKLIEKILTKS